MTVIVKYHKKPRRWRSVVDTDVRHVWKDDSGKEHRVAPTFYAEAGTPVDEHTGNDMKYVRTEVLR